MNIVRFKYNDYSNLKRVMMKNFTNTEIKQKNLKFADKAQFSKKSWFLENFVKNIRDET